MYDAPEEDFYNKKEYAKYKDVMSMSFEDYNNIA